MEEHVPAEDQPYADNDSPTAESPRYIADLDSMEEDTNEDYIDYPDEPEDGKEDDNEDSEEDLSEEHEPKDNDEDPEEDPNEEHKPEDEDTKKDESYEGFDETEPFKEDETAVTPSPPRHRRARISIKPQTTMAASADHRYFHLPSPSPTYD
ncbi:hypothetical protein Tco_0261018 [Tanacetum coccineum]